MPPNGYPRAVGANAVRLVQTDHRRIGELIRRLGRTYRAGETLRVQAAAEVRAHVEATRAVLLPFATDRLPSLSDDRDDHERVLHELEDLACRLDEAPDPVPATLAGELAQRWEAHLALEEPVLASLGTVVEVGRLRMQGDALRRCRDAALRAALRGTSRLRRPLATRAELYEKARRLQIEGRSAMSRAELQQALEQHSRG